MAASEAVDLELIAAFIDGRLTGTERERVVRLLAESEAAFEIYTEALGVRAELGEEKRVVSITEARRQRRLPWRIVGSLAAAAVVMIAVMPYMQGRRAASDMAAPAAEIASTVTGQPALPRTLVGDWDQRDWSVTRGQGSQLVDTTTAFRLGVRAVDLHVALKAGDSPRADRLASEILETLDGIELSDAVKAEYADVRAQLASGASADRVIASASRAEAAMNEHLQSFWFGFGRWVGAGELAASTRSREFFAEARTRRMLETAAERGGLPPADAELLRQIATLAEQGVAGNDFDIIRQHFRTLIKRHAG